MACGIHTCDYHSTISTTCIGNRSSCPTNRQLNWKVVEGEKIYASRIESLRQNILSEVQQWNLHRNWEITLTQLNPISSGDIISSSTFNAFDAMLGPIYGTYLNDEMRGDIIGDDEWASLIERYNIVRQNCICNSDCTCNAICACYGDCGCNYSDERLKTDITLICEFEGINIYSFAYKSNPNKRFKGVIAQELLKNEKYYNSVKTDSDGMYFVDYSKLPINFEEI